MRPCHQVGSEHRGNVSDSISDCSTKQVQTELVLSGLFFFDEGSPKSPAIFVTSQNQFVFSKSNNN